MPRFILPHRALCGIVSICIVLSLPFLKSDGAGVTAAAQSATIVITFDPPPPGECAPPRNVRATVLACSNTTAPIYPNAESNNGSLFERTDSRIGSAESNGVIGYNVYILFAPPP